MPFGILTQIPDSNAAFLAVAPRAVGLGESGRIYFGFNLEFPGVPLNSSVRHERAADAMVSSAVASAAA